MIATSEPRGPEGPWLGQDAAYAARNVRFGPETSRRSLAARARRAPGCASCCLDGHSHRCPIATVAPADIRIATVLRFSCCRFHRHPVNRVLVIRIAARSPAQVDQTSASSTSGAVGGLHPLERLRHTRSRGGLHGTSGWHIRVAHPGGTSGWHIRVAHPGGTSGWHIRVASSPQEHARGKFSGIRSWRATPSRRGNVRGCRVYAAETPPLDTNHILFRRRSCARSPSTAWHRCCSSRHRAPLDGRCGVMACRIPLLLEKRT